MMFEEGNLLFFDPFYFKNNSQSKPKFFIVLKNLEDKTILASLPSSQDFVPQIWQKKNTTHCIDIVEANFSCFVFDANEIITDTNWSFSKQTFIYAHQIDEYEIDNLKDIYPIEGIDYEIKGKLLKSKLQELLACLRKATNIKRKYKRLL